MISDLSEPGPKLDRAVAVIERQGVLQIPTLDWTIAGEQRDPFGLVLGSEVIDRFGKVQQRIAGNRILEIENPDNCSDPSLPWARMLAQ